MKLDLTIFHKKAKSLWLLLWRKDAFIFLLFVGLTSIFWWGHVMSSSRDMNIKVSIAYTGIPNKTLLEKELPTSLTMTLRDEGKRLRQLSRSNLQVTINLSEFLLQESGEVKLTADILRPRLQDLIPGSTHIQRITPEEISFAYQNQSSKLVPIHIQADVNTAPQHQLVGGAAITPCSVYVFGKQEIIDSISYILTEQIQITDLRDSTHVIARLISPEQVRVKPSEVAVSYYAEQFTEKSFVLPIHVEGQPYGDKLRLFPNKAEVTVRVCISKFSNIQAEDIQLVCHYPEKETKYLPLEVKTVNPHIHNIRISPSSVEYIIER